MRRKLEETFGQFDVPPAPGGSAGDAEEQLVRTLSDAVEKHRVVEIEYLKEGDESPTTRSVEPYTFERELPVWRVHTWDRTAGGPRTYRLDRMRSARLTDEEFEPRAGFDPNYLREPRTARLWHSPVVGALEARARRTPRSPTRRRSPTCRTRRTNGSSPRCSVTAARRSSLEPAEARAMVATRAKALQQELGVSARRKRPAARA